MNFESELLYNDHGFSDLSTYFIGILPTYLPSFQERDTLLYIILHLYFTFIYLRISINFNNRQRHTHFLFISILFDNNHEAQLTKISFEYFKNYAEAFRYFFFC